MVGLVTFFSLSVVDDVYQQRRKKNQNLYHKNFNRNKSVLNDWVLEFSISLKIDFIKYLNLTIIVENISIYRFTAEKENVIYFLLKPLQV